MSKSLISARPLTSFLTLLIASTLVVAATWSADVKIQNISVTGGQVYVAFTNPPFRHQCPVQNGSYVLGGTPADVDKMTSLATQALVKSRNVSVLFDNTCSAGGANGYPIVTGLALK